MNCSDAFEIKKNDVISIVGAGGKTTLMFELAKELSEKNKVLVTTTTKIYKPDKHSYNDIFLIEDKEWKQKWKTIKENRNGIYVMGEKINEDSKITAINDETLNYIKQDVDYLIIEADGSKKRILKGWTCYEPVISEFTTKTIGVINIKSLEVLVSNENIHRMDEFIKMTGATLGDKVDIYHLRKIIKSENGIFKNSIGEKILYINGVNCFKRLNMAYELLKDILEYLREASIKVVIGDTFNKQFITIRKQEVTL